MWVDSVGHRDVREIIGKFTLGKLNWTCNKQYEKIKETWIFDISDLHKFNKCTFLMNWGEKHYGLSVYNKMCSIGMLFDFTGMNITAQW